MVRRPVIKKYDDGTVCIGFYCDKRMCLTSIIKPDYKNDRVIVKTFADLENFSAAEMRDLWCKLTKPFISPPAIMERIRADVIECLQNVDRVDLVAVCLDSAAPNGGTMRL